VGYIHSWELGYSMSKSETPDPIRPGHLLAVHLRGEAAADGWRRWRDIRHREELRAALARDLRELHGHESPAEASALQRLRAEVQTLRAELQALREQMEAMESELPEAVTYLARVGGSRNGTPATGR
jgi:hypothetical protein